MTYKPDIMLYHDECADGFGAAWAAWTLWGKNVEYVAINYRQPPPYLAGKHVLIGDFSFKRDVLQELARTAASVIVLDHHKTAREELHDWIVGPNDDGAGQFWAGDDPLKLVRALDDRTGYPIAAMFDMNRSGARMVWDFCYPDNPPPTLIELVEDRDLWLFRHIETKPFNLWLRSEPFDFDRWSEIAHELDGPDLGGGILREAAAMQRFNDRKVSEISSRIRHMRIGGHVVPAANCPPEFSSDVAHAILAKHPSALFAATYNDGPHGRGFSLRSDEVGQHRLDVSEIAKTYGGGGHRNAAGFTVPL